MYCTNCGKKLEDRATYCYNCGAKIEDISNSPNIKSTVRPISSQLYPPSIPEEYKPISMWGYFGYQILFMIPCIGIILLLVFAFGGTKNVNLKNFARSYFCVLIILVVLVLLTTIITGVGLQM